MTITRTITLRIILDSRGKKTVEAEVRTEGGFGRAAAPGGASTGIFEAVVRDPTEAVAEAEIQVIPHLIGIDSSDQTGFDSLLHEIDGTGNFSRIGANVAVALSLACAKAAADSKNMPLWQHLGGVFVNHAPRPLGNVIGGGAHAPHATEIQEFLVVPTGCDRVRDGIFANARVHALVRELLTKRGINAGKGDEGAWAPPISDPEAFEILSEAADIASGEAGFDISLGIDVAASQLYDPETKMYRYRDGRLRSSEDQVTYIADLIDEYELVYVEDPLYEEDFDGFAALNKETGNRCLICGDDLFVTNKKRIKEGLKHTSANCVLIKPNQIGTLTDTFDAIQLAQGNGLETVMSHRSGETEDVTIAHLACAFNSVFIKTGVVGGERTAKLNELIRIEESIYERK
ncbi:MAG: phosphopyruvate hydratase [Methanomicrobiales archaeon]|nr:phosphopyruvate hydratase [Methanomicrobiales archaeon]